MNNKKRLIFILLGIIFLITIIKFYKTFSLDLEYTFESSVYKIEANQIKNISPNTSIELYKKYFDQENCIIKVMDNNNMELTNGYIYNGSKTLLYNKNNTLIKEYRNIIQGDINSDGLIDDSDLEKIAKLIIQKEEISDETLDIIDFDNNHLLDLTDILTLDKAITKGVETLSINHEELLLQTNESARLVVTTTPNYGVNQNMNWTSDNENIVKIDSSGIIIPIQEGEATITASTQDNQKSITSKIKIDNTIQLESYSGIIYVGGNKGIVKIKSVDYEGITCTSSNEKVATCKVEEENLILQGNSDGNVTITIISPNYGQVEYQLTSYTTYLNLFPSYGCSPPNRVGSAIISSFHNGEYTFEYSDKDIIKNAYIDKNKFIMEIGSKIGRGQVTIHEANGNNQKTFTLDTYQLNLPLGDTFKINEEKEIPITKENIGTLSCTSENEEVATCRIEDNRLFVKAISQGQSQMRIYNTMNYNNSNYNCGEVPFIAVVEGED